MQPLAGKRHSQVNLTQQLQCGLERLSACDLCPQQCRVNRLKNELGICQTGRLAKIAGFGPHFGEEAPLVGLHGSGTIFFAHCNLLCAFCQNHDFSHRGIGYDVEAEALAKIMLDLQANRVTNLNLVTPSHVVPQILEALAIAIRAGLNLPVIFNTSGFDSVDTLALLDGVVDIYMPDFKFADAARARKYCLASDYPRVAMAAIREMHRQVGDLVIDADGIARRGLLVRHLVMPGKPGRLAKFMRFLAKDISPDTYVNIMAQYQPAGEVDRFPELQRQITSAEFIAVVGMAQKAGLRRFDKVNPFSAQR